MKTNTKRLRLAALTGLLAVVMVAGSSCGIGIGSKAPTIFDPPKKDYDGFETLKQAEMEGTGDDFKEIKLFVPKGSVNESGNYVTGYDKGVSVYVRKIDPSTVKLYKGDQKEIVKKSGAFAYPNTQSTEQKTSKVQMANDDRIAYQTCLDTRPNYSGKYAADCKTTAVIKLDDDNYVSLDVTITSEKKEGKDTIVKELSEFYGFEIYYDQKAATEREEYFKKNPPKYARAEKAGYVFEIPVDYKRDNEHSSTKVVCYGPGGKAQADKNLFIASEYLSYSQKNDVSKEALQQLLEKQLSGSKVTLSDAKTNLEKHTVFKMELEYSGTRQYGYLLIGDSKMMMIYTGGQDRITDEQAAVVEHAFETVTTIY